MNSGDKNSKYSDGNLRGISTSDLKGGNTINIAYRLPKLRAQVKLFTVADETGYMRSGITRIKE